MAPMDAFPYDVDQKEQQRHGYQKEVVPFPIFIPHFNYHGILTMLFIGNHIPQIIEIEHSYT